MAPEYPPAPYDDEIDLLELLATLWSQLPVILVSVLCCGAFAVFYALTIADPVYEATARFELNDQPSGPNFGELGGLASLAGFSVPSGGGEADKLEDKIKSRPFILKMADTLDFYEDPELNRSLLPSGRAASLLNMLKGTEREDATPESISAGIIEKFRDAVTLTVNKNGVIDLAVSHADPHRAAEIANAIVAETLVDLKDDRRERSSEELDYLASELFAVQTDLENAAQDLQKFAVANNLRSDRELARSSAQLVELRDTLADLADTDLALAALERLGGEWGEETRAAFLDQHPIARDLGFRRLIGWSGVETNWSAPSTALLISARASLSEQRRQVLRSIETLEAEAQRDAEGALELAALQRTVKVQETIYEVMVRQFETQSFTQGFDVAAGDIIEEAVAPLEPVAPRKAIIAALGLALGAVLGAGLGMVFSLRKGILHTARAISDLAPGFTAIKASANLGRRARSSATSRLQKLGRVRQENIDEWAVSRIMSEDPSLTLIPVGADEIASGTALYLAQALSSSKTPVALLDLSRKAVRQATFDSTPVPGIRAQELPDGMVVCTPEHDLSVADAPNLHRMISELKETHPRLIVLAPPLPAGAAQARLALSVTGAGCVVTRAGRCRKTVLNHAISLMREAGSSAPALILA